MATAAGKKVRSGGHDISMGESNRRERTGPPVFYPPDDVPSLPCYGMCHLTQRSNRKAETGPMSREDAIGLFCSDHEGSGIMPTTAKYCQVRTSRIRFCMYISTSSSQPVLVAAVGSHLLYLLWLFNVIYGPSTPASQSPIKNPGGFTRCSSFVAVHRVL